MLNQNIEHTRFFWSYQLLLTYNPLDIVSAEGFNDRLLIPTLIRYRSLLLPVFI